MNERELGRPVGVALLGYGAIAGMHAVALRAAGARILVVAGPDVAEARAFATRHDIPVALADPVSAMGIDGVEAVVIASPTAVHGAQTLAALEAGRHVLVEIPLSTFLPEAEALVARAASIGRTLAVCHTLRYWGPVRVAHRWLDEQPARPTNVVARGLSLRHANVGWTGRQRSWTDDLLWHHGGHVVDQVLTILGDELVSVQATSGPVWPGSGRPMDHAISLGTRGGAVATIALSYHARISASEYLIIGEQETLLIAGTEVRTSSETLVTGLEVGPTQDAAVAAQDSDFLIAVRTGGATAADGSLILPSLRVLQAVSDLAAARASDTTALAEDARNPESDPMATNRKPSSR